VVIATTKPDVGPRAARGSRRPDLAARLKGRARALRTRIEGRHALVETIREANATLEPKAIAEWLVDQAHGWIPAPSWTVVAHDLSGHLNVIADVGLAPQLTPSLWSAANWVMRHGVEFIAGSQAADPRSAPGAAGTVIALPLVCRGRTMGVLVGLDPDPSTAAPAVGPSLLLALREILTPVAIALDNALALQKAEAQSVTDDLTRLFNARYLGSVLSRETKRALRSGRPLSLLFVDLDGFKLVNDRHGHLAGSRALTEVAAIARRCARETDIVARFGGDEFAFVLPDTASEGAVAVARRVTEQIRRFRFLANDGFDVRLTCSIGVATLPDVAAAGEDLLRAADTAMYRVKAAGKDGIHVAQVGVERTQT
jgi:diguanylate cyclase (GGDEF)-like protein